MLLRLALLNLTRSVRRSVLSMSSVVLGTTVIIVNQGVIDGFEENSIRAAVDHMTGHVQVRPAGYPTDEGLSHPLEGARPVDPALAAWLDRNTDAWTPRLMFVGEVVSHADAMPVRAISIDPSRDATVFPRDHWTRVGIEPVRAEDGLMVSSGVAGLLDLEVGDSVILQAHTKGGGRNALELAVAGIFDSGTPLLDVFGVLLTRDLARDLLQVGDAQSHLSIRLHERAQTEAFAAELAQRLGPEQEVLAWIEVCAPILALGSMRQAALNLVALALMLMSATGIANTILMAAYERIAEVGTLRAMGMTRVGVLQLFLLEGTLLGIVGASVGALLGTSIVLWFEGHGIEIPLALANGHVPISTVLYLRSDAAVTAFATGFGLFVAIVASIYPAVVASRLPPSEAIRA